MNPHAAFGNFLILFLSKCIHLERVFAIIIFITFCIRIAPTFSNIIKECLSNCFFVRFLNWTEIW
jgi:hypothetical protein